VNRVLINPSSGKGRSRRALAMLQQLAQESDLDLRVSRSADDLVEQARQAVNDGVERLVVAGGDGTFHFVAQGLAGSSCALGPVPTGRGNDFAAVLGIPTDLEAAVRFALSGPVREIDLGRVGDRFFTGYCGVGFDSEAANVAQSAPGFLVGPLPYIYGVLRTLITFEPPVLKVDREGESFEDRAIFAVVCNVSRFGGGMKIAPMARVDDGALDLVVARELTRLQILRVFPKVFSGEHIHHPAVQTGRLQSARIEVDRPLIMACDGEPIGRVTGGAIEVSVAPRALRVISSPP
jgi:diacylglycerol kinase (ATP)